MKKKQKSECFFPLSGVDLNTRPEVDLEVENVNEKTLWHGVGMEKCQFFVLK